MNRSSIGIFVIAFLVIVVFIYFRTKPYVKESRQWRAKYDSVLVLRDSLLGEIAKRDSNDVRTEAYIDSLENIKQPVITRYVEKIKRIDSAHSVFVLDEFKSIFADTNNR